MDTVYISWDEMNYFDGLTWCPPSMEREIYEHPALTDFTVRVTGSDRWAGKYIHYYKIEGAAPDSLMQWECDTNKRSDTVPDTEGLAYMSLVNGSIEIRPVFFHDSLAEDNWRCSIFETIVCIFLGVQHFMSLGNFRKSMIPPKFGNECEVRCDLEHETEPQPVKVYEHHGISEHGCTHVEVRVWHCPAWGVRGHYRNYADGRRTYVKPYVKGQQREKYRGRNYELFGKEQDDEHRL